MYKEAAMGFIGVLLLIGTPFQKPIGLFTIGEILMPLIGIGLLGGGLYLVEKNKKKK